VTACLIIVAIFVRNTLKMEKTLEFKKIFMVVNEKKEDMEFLENHRGITISSLSFQSILFICKLLS
jgi:hypothetical protein